MLKIDAGSVGLQYTSVCNPLSV